MLHHDIQPAHRAPAKATQKVVRSVVRHTPTDLLLTLLLTAVTVGVIAGTSWFVSGGTFGTQAEDQTQIEALRAREILTSEVRGEGKDAMVSYSYKGEALPEKLTEREVIELRTQSSFTESLGKDEHGKGIYSAVLFPRPSFLNQDGVWYYIEYGVAPKRIFDAAHKDRALVHSLIPRALAATDTVYASAGDGQVGQALNATWSGAYSATSGVAIYTDTTLTLQAAVTSGKVSGASIARGFLPFVTSTIPATATVSAASLNVRVAATPTGPGDAYSYVTVVQTSQATHTSLSDTDYDNVGSTEGIDAGDRETISGMTSGVYLSFPLNGTGRGWIAKNGAASNCSATAGVTCLGLREGHDITNNAPATDATPSAVSFNSSEASGTSQDPYLSVTYSAGFAFWQFDLF